MYKAAHHNVGCFLFAFWYFGIWSLGSTMDGPSFVRAKTEGDDHSEKPGTGGLIHAGQYLPATGSISGLPITLCPIHRMNTLA
jgi:hypothetical protein